MIATARDMGDVVMKSAIATMAPDATTAMTIVTMIATETEIETEIGIDMAQIATATMTAESRGGMRLEGVRGTCRR